MGWAAEDGTKKLEDDEAWSSTGMFTEMVQVSVAVEGCRC